MSVITCRQCGKPVPVGHRFCGYCGAKSDDLKPKPSAARAQAETAFIESAPTKRKARLVLLRGMGGDGASYYLNSTEHICGRTQGTILFPDDTTVSPKQANFFYRDGHLFVKDLDSANGTFMRLRGRVPLGDGDRFVCGEELFELHTYPDPMPEAWENGACFCGTPPLWPWKLSVTQILTHGRAGERRAVESGSLTIGREDCDLNFPQDRFMSHTHARVGVEAGRVTLEDAGSKNGTYYRIRDEIQLDNGDYVFVGKQLIRIEIV